MKSRRYGAGGKPNGRNGRRTAVPRRISAEKPDSVLTCTECHGVCAETYHRCVGSCRVMVAFDV